MAHLSKELYEKCKSVVALYPEARSALIPLCHMAQGQEGWLTSEAIEDIAELTGVTPAEVRGTASFYDMLHLEPVGKYVVAMCTNIACMLNGSMELLDHAEEKLGISAGGTTSDGEFTLEESECLAGCDKAPCVQVNHRFFGPLDNKGFDQLLDDLKAGKLSDDVPSHGVLSRVDRRFPLALSPSEVAAERAEMENAKSQRDEKRKVSEGAN